MDTIIPPLSSKIICACWLYRYEKDYPHVSSGHLVFMPDAEDEASVKHQMSTKNLDALRQALMQAGIGTLIITFNESILQS